MIYRQILADDFDRLPTMLRVFHSAPGGGHGMVWVNSETHVYHTEGSRFYGTTKKGKYMTEAEAAKEGDKPGRERN